AMQENAKALGGREIEYVRVRLVVQADVLDLAAAKALGGREVEYVRLDDESDPAKATDNINRLVTRDKVDVVIGTVHSGVAAAMLRITKESGVMHIIPNAGLAQ